MNTHHKGFPKSSLGKPVSLDFKYNIVDNNYTNYAAAVYTTTVIIADILWEKTFTKTSIHTMYEYHAGLFLSTWSKSPHLLYPFLTLEEIGLIS